MSYWSNNPELYDEIIYNRLIEEGLASDEDDRPLYEIVNEFMQKPDSWKLASNAEADYWGGRIDDAMARRER